MPTRTCDIFRHAGITPVATGVAFDLTSAFPLGREKDESGPVSFSHIGIFDLDTDVRDGFNNFTVGNGDSVWVPDQYGREYLVRYVERIGRNTGGDRKKVYLDRKTESVGVF